MQKYSPIDNSTPNMQEDSENGSFYWCADADKRIEELERALKSCALVLNQELGVQRTFQLIAAEALREANKALMERKS